MSTFTILNAVDVSEHVEQKNRLTYLSWAWAWAELKKRYPNSFYTIYETATGCFYHSDGKTCWVKTGVTVVDGEYRLEHIEYLPVMDFKNASIPAEKVTSVDVNKAIQRSLTKAVARHGLGLYIYAGEDLPEGAEKPEDAAKGKPADMAPPPVSRKAMVADAMREMGIDDDAFKALVVRLRGHGEYPDKPMGEMNQYELSAALQEIAKEVKRVGGAA